MSGESLREELVRLVELLSESESLRDWFEQLSLMTAARRRVEVTWIASRMTAAGERAELVCTMAMLAEQPIFDAVQLAVSDGMMRR